MIQRGSELLPKDQGPDPQSQDSTVQQSFGIFMRDLPKLLGLCLGLKATSASKGKRKRIGILEAVGK